MLEGSQVTQAPLAQKLQGGGGAPVLDRPWLILNLSSRICPLCTHCCWELLLILSPVVPATQPALLTSLPVSTGGTPAPYRDSTLRRLWATGHRVTL